MQQLSLKLLLMAFCSELLYFICGALCDFPPISSNKATLKRFASYENTVNNK